MSITVLPPDHHRVVVYIDGFNFYFGLRSQGWKCYYWLHYHKLAKKLASKIDAENPTLVATKYFTSRITFPPDKRKRQGDYIESIEALGGVQVIYGNYKESEYSCSACQRPNFIPTEKQTDVNIAVAMLSDAYEDKFDTAILLGGDSDLVPPIKAIRRIFPQKRVICCFPPARHSKEIKNSCNGQLHLKEADLKNNQLPDEITKMDGHTLKRPRNWK